MTSSAIKTYSLARSLQSAHKHRGERAQIDTDLAMTLTTTYDRNSESSNRIFECVSAPLLKCSSFDLFGAANDEQVRVLQNENAFA